MIFIEILHRKSHQTHLYRYLTQYWQCLSKCCTMPFANLKWPSHIVTRNQSKPRWISTTYCASAESAEAICSVRNGVSWWSGGLLSPEGCSLASLGSSGGARCPAGNAASSPRLRCRCNSMDCFWDLVKWLGCSCWMDCRRTRRAEGIRHIRGVDQQHDHPEQRRWRNKI